MVASVLSTFLNDVLNKSIKQWYMRVNLEIEGIGFLHDNLCNVIIIVRNEMVTSIFANRVDKERRRTRRRRRRIIIIIICGFSESHTRLSVRICGHIMMRPMDVF